MKMLEYKIKIFFTKSSPQYILCYLSLNIFNIIIIINIFIIFLKPFLFLVPTGGSANTRK